MMLKSIILASICLLSCAYAQSFQDVSDLVRLHPDVGVKVPELVPKYKYPLTTHVVTTEDGYKLTMHRIPHGKNNAKEENKPVVFLMHGILASSADWVLMGPQQGLGYLLADRGYDVWMGNARGNTYSREHKKLNPDSIWPWKRMQYWNFSWHEVGTIDLPTMIDYVLNETRQEKLFYIAHSQGTTAFFVMTSTHPEYNDKIRLMSALSPVAYMDHTPNFFLRLISYFTGFLDFLGKIIGMYEFLPSNALLDFLNKKMCDEDSKLQPICNNILFLIAGYDKEQLNKTMVPVMLSNTPAGSSTKQFVHFGQIIKSGKFCKFDYGFFGNLKKYKSSKPPKYDISKISAPVALYAGRNDNLVSTRDAKELFEDLPNSVSYYEVEHDKFSHLDFLWAIDVVPLLYNEIFNNLEKY